MKAVRKFYVTAAVVLVFVLAVLVGALSTVSSEASAAQTTVYIKGAAGNDANGGTSADDAVRSFARAKELLGGSDGTIAVCGQINVTSDQIWEADEGQLIKIARADGFSAKVAAVHQNATLFIKDIEISDGGNIGATSESYLVDVYPSAKLALGGRVIINDEAGGKNVRLYEKASIEVRAPLTGGNGSVCITSQNPIGGTVFEHKIAEGTSDYTVTETDAAAFVEISELLHSNIVVSEIRDNTVVLVVTPENRIELTLRLADADGNVISEQTETVVKGSNGIALPEFSKETDGIPNVPKELTHIASVKLNGGENLAINKTDGTAAENRNETVGMKGSEFRPTENGWVYRFSEALENSVLEVRYEPDAFAVSYDLCGGSGAFPEYLVPYGASNPDCYGDASVKDYVPSRRGYKPSGYTTADGEDYRTMPAHDITFKAGWRIELQTGIAGAATVKVGQVVVLSSTTNVFDTVDYSYFWYKDGAAVEGQFDEMLFLSKVEQTGNYVLQVVASDPLGYAPTAVASSAAVRVAIEKYGAGQEEKPDVPPTDIETDDPIPENAELTVVSLGSKEATIKTPSGYRAAGRFFVSLKANGKDVELKKTITVKIKLDEKLLNNQSLAVVMIGKNGEPTFREFGIENGVLVFETDTLGEFALFVKTVMPWWAWIIVGCGAACIVVAAVIFVIYKKSFVITFETDGGTPVKRKLFLGDARAPKLPVCEKNGAEFAGWYLDEDKTQQFDFKKMPKADIILFAKWKPKFGEKTDKNA